MATVHLKNGETIRDIKTYENWEQDNNFLILKDFDHDEIILSKDQVFKINGF